MRELFLAMLNFLATIAVMVFGGLFLTGYLVILGIFYFWCICKEVVGLGRIIQDSIAASGSPYAVHPK